MPRKKKVASTTKTARFTQSKKIIVHKHKSAIAVFFESLRLGESYTSLILGIVAVIVSTLVVLSFIHNTQEKSLSPEVTPTIAQSNSFAISPTITKTPTQKAAQKPEKPQAGKTYTVIAGDNLWMIAEKVYGSGYNWVDIAKANKLANPGTIYTGNKLVLPQVKKEIATVHTADDNLSTSTQTSITSTRYTVVPGDTLWAIAVRAYGDGYQWTKIAKANNLSNPNIIHKNNVLKIPRG